MMSHRGARLIAASKRLRICAVRTFPSLRVGQLTERAHIPSCESDMWLRILTAVTLCAVGAGKSDVSFICPTQLQMRSLDLPPTLACAQRVRYPTRHPRATTARGGTTMMAGPNRGQKADFFADWPVLEAELRAYLAEREAGEPKKSGEAKPRGAGGAFLNFLSVNPTQMALENEPEKDEWDGDVNVLSYSELTRYGYGYLIEPMMRSGGYVAASKRMGIELESRTLKDREYYDRTSPIVGLDMKERAETDGFLTLGSAREERLERMAKIDREERKKSLFEKQAMMDKSQKYKTKAADKGTAGQASLLKPRRKGVPGGRSKEELDAELFRKPGLPEELRDVTEWVPPVRVEDGLPPQPLLFNLAQRANAVAVCACLALAFGKGTVDAMERGLVSREVAEVAQPASLFLLGLNVASAAAGASMAKSKGRSAPLWVFKGVLAGLASVLELKGLPELVPISSSDGAQESSGASGSSGSSNNSSSP